MEKTIEQRLRDIEIKIEFVNTIGGVVLLMVFGILIGIFIGYSVWGY